MHQSPVAVVEQQVVVPGSSRHHGIELGLGRCIVSGLSQGRRHQ